jgi:hypothetical protein
MATSRHIDEVPVHSLHVGNPSVQRDKVVIGIPRGIRVADSIFNPELRHPLVRMRLGIREEL